MNFHIMLGLIIASIALGYMHGQVIGCLVFGIGLMTYGIFESLLTYLNDKNNDS